MRQLAAILFTDMVGFTALMGRDESTAMRLRDRHRQVLRETHDKYHGEIMNYYGDGTLSIFSSAVEAARCAIEMQQKLQKAPVVPMRIGLHFGEVVKDKEGLFGNSVNIASRIESMAVPGSILLSSRLQEELVNQQGLECVSLGMFELKNLDKPMELFALQEDGIAIPTSAQLQGKGQILQSSVSVSNPKLENFVGREKELGIMRNAWHQAISGKGIMLGITGEPGIGKTTLVEDFLLEIEEAGNANITVRGRCSERLAGTEAYLPFLEILEELIKDEKYSLLLKQLAPSWYVQLRPFSAEESKILEMAGLATQERRKKELNSFLSGISNNRPVLIYIDDLHWADVSTIDFLSYFAPRISGIRIMVVLTYRLEDMVLIDHPFLQIRTNLIAKKLIEEVSLPFLDPDEIGTYLDSCFPNHNFSKAFIHKIYQRTEGSPLFMVDLVNHLQAKKIIDKQDGQWEITKTMDVIEADLPDTITGMIESKMNRLSVEERKIVEFAAVQGYRFDSAVMGVLLNMERWEVEETLQKLAQEHKFVIETEEIELPDHSIAVQYQFVHVLYQNFLLGTLPANKKIHLCSKVAESLYKMYEDNPTEVAFELAALFEESRSWQKAFEFYEMATKQVAKRFAYEESIKLGEKGLNVLKYLPADKINTKRELDLLLITGPACSMIYGWSHEKVSRIYERSYAISKQLNDSTRMIPILSGLIFTHCSIGNLIKSVEFGKEGLDIALKTNDLRILPYAYFQYGQVLTWTGSEYQSIQNFEKALSLYDVQIHPSLLFEFIVDAKESSLAFLSWSLTNIGYPDQGIKCGKRAVEWASMLNHPSSMSEALTFLAFGYVNIRDFVKAGYEATLLLELAEEHGFPFRTITAKTILGIATVHSGKEEEGLLLVREGLDIFRNLDSDFLKTPHYGLMAEAYLLIGDKNRGLEIVEEGLEISERTGEKVYHEELLRLKGEFNLIKDKDEASAEENFLKSLRIAATRKNKWRELRSTISLARLWKAQGKLNEAYHVLKEIYEWFSEGFDTVDIKDAKALLAELKDQLNTEQKPSSIGILPFVNMSSDPEQEYFCDGVTEEILNALAQVKDIKVIARTSSFSFKGKNEDIREISKQLGVDHILEGSVRKAGSRLRITAQLIKAEDGSHLWSERFDRELEDVFAIQDEIAQKVTTRLESSLVDGNYTRRPSTTNLKAYELYLQGKFFLNKRSANAIEKAFELFQQVIQIDPNFPLGYAGLADAYILIGIGYGSKPMKNPYRQAKKVALQALQLEDNLAEAHTSLAYALTILNESGEAKTHFEKALQINPDLVQAHQWYAHYFIVTGEFENQVRHFKKALELDPLSILLKTEAGWPLMWAGRLEEAIPVFKNILEMEPGFALARYDLAQCYGGLKQYGKAIKECVKALQDWNNSVFIEAYLGYLLATTGKTEQATAILSRFEKLNDQGAQVSTYIADVYIGLGNKEMALNWLERASTEDSYWLLVLDRWISILLGSELLDGDQRYEKLLNNLGLRD